MNIKQARDNVNQKFRYQSDGKMDVWEILDTNEDIIKGDCEDYSLTLIWLAENKNIFKFIFSLLLMKYVIWYTKTPSGTGHVITYVRSEKKFIDNIKKDFYTKKQYRDGGFKFVFPFASLLILPKLIFSYTLGPFFR